MRPPATTAMRSRSGGKLDANHPANFVLMMCIGMDDPGLLVLPTHRLFRGLPEMDSTELASKLGRRVHDPRGRRRERPGLGDLGRDRRSKTIREPSACSPPRTSAGRWLGSPMPGGAAWLKWPRSTARDWQGLGVSILAPAADRDAAGRPKDLPKPRYVHLVEEVVEGLDSDEKFPLAALVMPATVGHIRTISEHAERMPAKSTYFYPKLLSGMVINPLECAPRGATASACGGVSRQACLAWYPSSARPYYTVSRETFRFRKVLRFT